VGRWYECLSFRIAPIISSSFLSQTDASRFGQAYLEKFGWDVSKGLGASGEGRTSAIKATQKLDMLGIGMRHQNDVEGGIAWRQNRDFEDLLRRLNGTTTETTDSTGLLDSFHKARENDSESLEGGDGVENVKDDGGDGGLGEEEREGVMAKKEKKKKKKKRKATTECEEELEEEEGRDRKVRKKKRKKSSSKDGDGDDGRAPVPSSIESELPSLCRPPRRKAPHAEESGSIPMATATATAIRPTTVTAPVPIRAPYVAHTFCGSEKQRLMYSMIPIQFLPSLFHSPTARARTERASSHLNAWLRPTRQRSPRSLVSRLPHLHPRTRPLSLALSPSSSIPLLSLSLLPPLPLPPPK
jgi:G-patch protein